MQVNLGHTKQKIIDRFSGDESFERCAVLIGRRSDSTFYVMDVLEVPNTSDNTRLTFSMKAGDVRSAVTEAGYEQSDIIGCLHVHTRGAKADPSWDDVDELPPGTLGVIYHQTSGRVTFYTHEAGFIGKEEA